VIRIEVLLQRPVESIEHWLGCTFWAIGWIVPDAPCLDRASVATC
jgi:hypothetical protein